MPAAVVIPQIGEGCGVVESQGGAASVPGPVDHGPGAKVINNFTTFHNKLECLSLASLSSIV